MAQKVAVQQFRGLKTVHVEDGATVGAQVGVNLYDEDGKLITSLTESGIRNIFQTFIASGAGGTIDLSGYATLDQLVRILSAFGQTGIADEDDTLALSVFNATTLHIGAIRSAYFESLAAGFPVIQLPAQDIPLSACPLPSDGNWIRFVGVDYAGAVYWSAEAFAGSTNILQLGTVFISRVGGVNSFMAPYMGNNGTLSKPMLASIDTYSLQMIEPLIQSVPVAPIAGSLTFTNQIGTVTGLSINWHEQVTAGVGTHEIIVPQNAVTPFTRIYAGIAQGGPLPAQVTAVNPTQYWNGAALVPLANNNRASVQRLCVTWRGLMFVQYGEVEYASFDDAVAAMGIAPFTIVFPKGGYTEILRMALQKSCVNLSDPASAKIIFSGGDGSGGSGTGGTSPTGTGFVRVSGGTQDAVAVPETGTGAVVRADSPAMTSNPTAPTQATADNSTRLATTAYVKAVVASLPSGGTVTSVTAVLPITVSVSPTVTPQIGINPATTSAAGSLSAADKVKLDNTSGVNTGDQDLSPYAPKNNPIFTGTKTSINAAAAANAILEFLTNSVVNGQIISYPSGAMGLRAGAALVPVANFYPNKNVEFYGPFIQYGGLIDIIAKDAASNSSLYFYDDTYSTGKGILFWDRATNTIKLRRVGGATLTVGDTGISSDFTFTAPNVQAGVPPTDLVLLESWVPFGGGYVAPYAMKTNDGRVILGGTMKGGATYSGVVIAQLPVGMRPATLIGPFLCFSAGGPVSFFIGPGGNINANVPLNATNTGLDGISFQAA